MKTRLLIIIGIISVAIAVTTIPVSAQCDYDPSNPHATCDDTQEFLILDSPVNHIEKINGSYYEVSESVSPHSSADKIIFHDVEFSLPYTTDPPRHTYSDIVFSDGTKETLSILFDEPAFSDHITPQVGFVAKHDGYGFMVSVDLKEMSPSKQYKMGVRFQEIQCKDGLELIGKIPYAHPKCVKPESVEKLIAWGWATSNKAIELTNPTEYVVEKNGVSFELQYSLNGATLENIAYDVDANSVHVSLNESMGGHMTISVPRDLIYATMGNNIDDVFFVLIDGMEIMYGEKITDDTRIITVWFPKNTNDIEIIGTFWI